MSGRAENNQAVGVAPSGDRAAAPPLRRQSDQLKPYLRGAGLSVACVWLFVALYLIFMPRTYVSRWVLNLPGAASSVSLSLDSIGQSSSTPNSPFSSSALSPKVVYKEIAEGERVRVKAAEAVGVDPSRFGKLRVKLIDETALMLFEVSASSPEDAKRRSDALLAAFNAELDALRNDELEKRASAVRANLADYQSQVRQARDKTISAQRETGLVSTTQYAEMITSLTGLRRHMMDLSAEADKLTEEQARLSARLGVNAEEADRALKLAADPNLQRALTEYNETAVLFSDIRQRFGPNHPQYVAMAQRRDAARNRFIALIRSVQPDDRDIYNLTTAVELLNQSPRADLYLTLVRNDAALRGKQRELTSLTADSRRLETEIKDLSTAASRLEDLKKDQLVADAVFSTAMARLDSSKSDIYGSYPIVQVVSAPDLPFDASQPRPFYAALGGLSGTFFACLAWIFAWLQANHRVTRRKSI